MPPPLFFFITSNTYLTFLFTAAAVTAWVRTSFPVFTLSLSLSISLSLSLSIYLSISLSLSLFLSLPLSHSPPSFIFLCMLPFLDDADSHPHPSSFVRVFVVYVGIDFEKGRTGHGIYDLSYYGLFQPSLLQ
jgi:hypothetical protein